MKQKIIDIIMYPTKTKRDERNHEIYLLRLNKMTKLKSSELQSLYISTKAKYEKAKTITNILTIGLIVSVISNLWSKSVELFGTYITYLYDQSDVAQTVEMLRVSVALSITIIGIIGITLVIILFVNINETYKLYKELLIIESHMKG